jgi:DNA-binding NarL/FixJ family response regulator
LQLFLPYCMDRDSLTVFIADDSYAVLDSLAEMLAEIDGLRVVGTASDVPGSVRQVQEKLPEVLILDLDMPGGSGIQVLRAAKALDPAPVVIIVTNHGFDQVKRRCLAEGADHFLDKSRDTDVLREILQALIRA